MELGLRWSTWLFIFNPNLLKILYLKFINRLGNICRIRIRLVFEEGRPKLPREKLARIPESSRHPPCPVRPSLEANALSLPSLRRNCADLDLALFAFFFFFLPSHQTFVEAAQVIGPLPASTNHRGDPYQFGREILRASTSPRRGPSKKKKKKKFQSNLPMASTSSGIAFCWSQYVADIWCFFVFFFFAGLLMSLIVFLSSFDSICLIRDFWCMLDQNLRFWFSMFFSGIWGFLSGEG